ncbi:hypothetical protein EST38_g3788 [Candolleomyces aberdarensis]|uniref:Uncharacterized protein n=1 Tax=Candolleomyces aberdarensis TaxID=2316362 RepID=A0A4Q2DR92_9AGAR|nr:hypothetical protein EST38_g3788 [Candolleomyces aberdarensis]
MEKTDSYRDSLGIVGGRPSTKLGRHLSRIAGSDKEDWMDGTNPDYSPLRREDLAGRRKKRLAKLSDMIQAYEYLCHVGEAQKWIEGCLDKELAFDVVEIEEGLRNGVILAKLVRAFDGEQAVPQIYQAPKLDFRHSANINIFISFVRKEGLPERFIFELADLHDKKNIPKVIYCIHALSHLLFRRGRAEHIGNLLGQLEFSEDQLQRTQKGLKEFGIAGPNFGSVGRELAKDINEEPEVEVETQEERRDRLLLESESSIVQLQACCRAMLLRQSYKSLQARLEFSARHITKVQTHCLGALVRRKLQARRQVQARLQPWAIALQAAALGVLARRRWNAHLQRIKACAPQVKKMQAQICGVLQRRRYAMLKAALQKLDVVTPDVASVQFQAACRSHDIATFLQALLRGVMQRRAYQAKLDHYNANISKVVKIQALFRAKETREQYRQLTLVKNVTIGTIKSFVHLLDDSEGDFQEELKVQRLRKRVVESIRENQSLETEVDSFDIKIALVENAQDFVDLVRAKGTYGTVNAASRATRVSLLAVHGDPFFGSHLVDHDTRRKLELYQQLFYILQSRAEYFTRLFTQMSADNVAEAKFVERVVLTVFGYGLGNREDYLLLKLFQFAIRDQIAAASALEEVVNGHPTYINVAFACLRPKQATYARETLQAIIKDVIESDDLDLEVNARTIHRIRIDQEEMRTGVPSHLPKDLPYMEAMEDPQTRFIYIRHLQMLRWWVEQFVTVITQSTKTMPYGIRYLARETLTCLRLKFPDAPERLHIQCIGRLIYSQYIKPVINTPETFDVVSKAVDVQARRNLARISEVLDQVASGVPFDKDSHYYLPINEYVDIAIARMSAWFLEVANVPDAETQYHAHEFLDVTVQPKPIYISPNEIYSLHTILSRHQDQLAGPDDILRVILSELGEAPHLDNEELKDARDTVITLELNDRFAGVRDPDVEEETRWVQAKRGVLAILRVQPAQDLLDSLMGPVTERNELLWEDILEAEMENELKQMPRRQPSAAIPYSAYRLEHIRSLKFAAVKVLAIDNLLELEKQGKITREDGFQGILNAIAGDVRRKHRKRIQRQQEIRSMSEALRQLAERKKHLLAQIDSYDKFVESTMTTIQKGKGKNRFAIPFAKQYSYMRKLGQAPQFGSFKYTAKYLFEKGILLSIDSYSPMKFDRLQITMSSNIAGVFTVVLGSTMLRGVTSEIAKEDIRMEDLLQARFENRRSLSILGGKVKVNLEPFLDRINKK